MTTEIQINNSIQPAGRYVTWAWSACSVRVTDPAGITGSQINVQLGQLPLAGGGAIRFSKMPSGAGSPTLTLAVPRDGTSVAFVVRGFTASTADSGVQLTAVPSGSNNSVGSVAVMVRIRKNAVSLTSGERDRLISAFAQLNNKGGGRYADFAGTHVEPARDEAHGKAGFLPWHRAFILDLERELQRIDPSVALPYWRFDQPAPALFTPDFLGKGVIGGPGTANLSFSATNPLQFWKAGPSPGLTRDPKFNVALAPPGPLGQAAALQVGNPGATFKNFRAIEARSPRNYHGGAHVSFSGPIDTIRTAARDPLFFLLHCNVDRLWALWQKQNARFDVANAASFENVTPPNRIGHNLGDTMWPWNDDKNFPRPKFALGGPMAVSPCVSAPGPQPKVGDCFDYQGTLALGNNMGYSYDDVPL